MSSPLRASGSADAFGFTKTETDQGNEMQACYKGHDTSPHDSGQGHLNFTADNKIQNVPVNTKEVQVYGNQNTIIMDSKIDKLVVNVNSQISPVYEYESNTEKWYNCPHLNEAISLQDGSPKLRKTLYLLAANCKKEDEDGNDNNQFRTIKSVLNKKNPGREISKISASNLSSFLLTVSALLLPELNLSLLYDLLKGNNMDNLAIIIENVAREPDEKLSLPDEYPSLNHVLTIKDISFNDAARQMPDEAKKFRRLFGLKLNDDTILSLLSHIYLHLGEIDLDSKNSSFDIHHKMSERGASIRKLIEVLYYLNETHILSELEKLVSGLV